MDKSVAKSETLPAAKYAITDLYDEQKQTFLIQYPPLLIVVFGLVGVAAFALSGFLGYIPQGQTLLNAPFIERVFHEPWPIFFWLCALMIALQTSIFRDSMLTRQRVQTLIVSFISIILVILLYFYRDQLLNITNALGSFLRSLNIPIGSGLVYAIINYGIIAIFWFDTIRRWFRRYQGKPIAPQIDIFQRKVVKDASLTLMPSLSELISGDVIAGGVLTALLWLLFSPSSLQAIGSAIGYSGPAEHCYLSCNIVDRNQTFIYFPLGLMILALTAVVNGLGELNAVNRKTIAIEAAASASSLDSTGKGTKGVVQTIIEVLLAAISRQFLNFFRNLALALRAAAWPALIFIGTAGLAVAAKYIEYYMHANSCRVNSSACDLFSAPNDFTHMLLYGGIAAIGGTAAVLCITSAAALLVYNVHVAQNTLRFASLTGFIILLTLWIFELALSGFNELLSVLGVTQRWPFAQPELLTGISFAALVIYGAQLFISRARSKDSTPLFTPQVGMRTMRRRQEQLEKEKAAASVSANTTPDTLNTNNNEQI